MPAQAQNSGLGTVCDAFRRRINYMRVSVTDRCNYRCLYCVPASGVVWKPSASILSYEEIVRIVRIGAGLGVGKVRLTGGEPLVRSGICRLVEAIAQVDGVDDLSLTTNGALLGRMAVELRQAGLQRVNVSLDTLQPDRFRKITRYGDLHQVLAGIQAAENAGLQPIKINAVVVRGFNDDEVPAIAALTRTHSWHVRFIELMPVGSEEACLPGVCDGSSRGPAFVSAAEMRQLIEQDLGELEPTTRVPVGNGPASYYHLAGAAGSVGFISAISEHFCSRCNRLRLTADGNLRPCLMADGEIDLMTPMRAGASDADLAALIVEAVAAKPERHRLGENERPVGRLMAQIGG